MEFNCAHVHVGSGHRIHGRALRSEGGRREEITRGVFLFFVCGPCVVIEGFVLKLSGDGAGIVFCSL